MQKAALYGLVLVCVCMLFALSGPSAQKVASGDGGGGTTSPVPVSVANFPATQSVVALRPIPITGSVAVTNFPAVQQVAGTVNVGNLPLVQNVAGIMAVSNLPFDANGNLRIAPAAPAAPPFALLKIADGLAITPSLSQLTPIGTFNVAGFRHASLFARFTMESLSYSWCVSLKLNATLDGTTFGDMGSLATQCSYTLPSPPMTFTHFIVEDLAVPEVTINAMESQQDANLPGSLTVDAWLYLQN